MRPVQDTLLAVLMLVLGVALWFTWFTLTDRAPEVAQTEDRSSPTLASEVPAADGPEATRQPREPEVSATADEPEVVATPSADAAEEVENTTVDVAASTAVQEASDLLASDDPLTIVVLGDSTSDDLTEWVHLWARDLARVRPVWISHWDQDPGTEYDPTVALSDDEAGDGAGAWLTIWNGSVSGGTAASALEGLDGFIPQAPDFVLLNVGHDQTVVDFADEADALHAELEARYGDIPVLMVLQPQQDDANAAVRAAGEQWAQDAGVGVIDVAAAFAESDADEDLLLDELHPNSAGQELWAQVVGAALD